MGFKNESCFRCWPYNIKSCIIYKVNTHFTGEQISVKLPLDENRVLTNYGLGGKLWSCNTSFSATWFFLAKENKKAEESWLNRFCFVSFFSFLQKNRWCQKCQNTIMEAFPPLLYAFWQHLIIIFQINFRMMINKGEKEVPPDTELTGLMLSLSLMFTDSGRSSTHALAPSWERTDCSLEISGNFGVSVERGIIRAKWMLKQSTNSKPDTTNPLCFEK